VLDLEFVWRKIMSIGMDEKSKYYTNIINKDRIPSTIHTLVSRIDGNLHVRIDKRVKDEINQGEQFFAVTDATIFNLEGKKLYATEFMLVNREHVVWIVPHDENETTEHQS
jgi:hypothetical protein